MDGSGKGERIAGSRADGGGTPYLATACALFTVLVWGGSPLMTKLGTVSVDGLALAALRTVAAVPFALLLIVLLRLPLPSRGTDKYSLLAVAVTGLVGFPVFFTIGVDLTTSGHAAVAQSATPVFAGLLDAAVNRRWPRPRWWMGVVVAFSGATMLIAEAIGLGAGEATWYGDLLVIAGAFCAALSFVFAARLSRIYGTPAMAMWSVVAGGAMFLPYLAASLTPSEVLAWDTLAWSSILYLSAGSSVFAFIAWFYALHRGGISRVSAWHFCLPVVGLVLSYLVLDEPLTVALVAAAGVILAGVALVQRR